VPVELRARLAVAVSVVAVTAAGLVVSMGPATVASANPIGDCSTTTGVIVVVDFTHWGGDIERGCDATITNGYHALHAAGYTTAGDTQDGPGFVCRIDDDPPPADESCITTPPPDAYWAYWHADVGQDTWTYSQQGAMSYRPPPGSVDAWTFGSTDIGPDGQPTFSPSSVRATNTSGSGTTTSTAPTTTAPTTTVPTSTAPQGSPGPSSPSPGAGPSPASGASSSSRTDVGTTGPGSHAVSSTTTPRPTTPTTSATSSAPRGQGRSSTSRIVDAAPVASEGQTAGSPAPVLAGAGVVLALAAAACVLAWRRRRAG
jgi:hypothetical protein